MKMKDSELQSLTAVLRRFSGDAARLSGAHPSAAIEKVSAAKPFSSEAMVRRTPETIEILLLTVDLPSYKIILRQPSVNAAASPQIRAELENLAWQAARQIDVLRVSHERCRREIEAQELIKLAAQAELSALRAQINPHFLFNALNTIGYLIESAPDKASVTLLQLTQLLRGVLGVRAGISGRSAKKFA